MSKVDLDKMTTSLFPVIAIKDCMKELNSNEELLGCETQCGMLMLDNEETVQVKIIITKVEEDFIGPFEVVPHIKK